MQNIVHDSRLLKCASEIAHFIVGYVCAFVCFTIPVHFSDNLGVINEFDVACHMTRLHDFVTDHLHI